MVETARIHPWVGETYRGLPTAYRLFLLGESMYTDTSGKYPESELIRLIGITLDGTWAKRNNFYKRVYRTVANRLWSQSTQSDRVRFWSRVAFYNYVQLPVVGDHHVDPSHEMWTASSDPFRTVFGQQVPGKVIVFGKDDLQKYLSESGCLKTKNDGTWEIITSNHRCPALVIHHPSYRKLSALQRQYDRDAVAAFIRGMGIV